MDFSQRERARRPSSEKNCGNQDNSTVEIALAVVSGRVRHKKVQGTIFSPGTKNGS